MSTEPNAQASPTPADYDIVRQMLPTDDDEAHDALDSIQQREAALTADVTRLREALARELDTLECIESGDQMPGHVCYLTKAGMAALASGALTRLRALLASPEPAEREKEPPR